KIGIGGKANLVEATEEMLKRIKNEEAHDSLQRQVEGILDKERDPKIIEKNYKDLDNLLKYAALNDDEAESVGFLRDFALNRFRNTTRPTKEPMLGKKLPLSEIRKRFKADDAPRM